MDKDTALDLLKLDPGEKPKAIAARYKQISAFLEYDGNAATVLQELLDKANKTITDAYEVLPQDKQPPTSPGGQGPGGIPGGGVPIVVPNEFFEKVKAFVFPRAGLPAGEFFSDQWWQSYKRAVMIGLTLAALALYYVPELNITWPQPEPVPTPEPEPKPDPKPDPIRDPDPKPWPPPNPQPIIIPNPQPVIVEPTEDPSRFLFGVFNDLKKGMIVSNKVKDPTNFTLKLNLISSRTKCPDYFISMPLDAMTVFSKLPGRATIRVKEKYFTGSATINNYMLESDNGVWKLASVENVGPDLDVPAVPAVPADAGDPVKFILEHISAASHMTVWKAYDNLDTDFKINLDEKEFIRLYVNGWFVPRQADQSTAITVESQDASKAVIRIIPDYVTTRQVTATDGSKADLLFYLVNRDGKWRIEDIRRSR